MIFHMLDWHLHMVVVACNGSVCNSCVRWCGRCAGERVYTPKDDGCQPRKWKGKPCRLPYLDMHTACELRAFHLTNGVQGCAVCMCTQRKGCIFSTQPPPSRSLAHPFTEPHLPCYSLSLAPTPYHLRPYMQHHPSPHSLPPSTPTHPPPNRLTIHRSLPSMSHTLFPVLMPDSCRPYAAQPTHPFHSMLGSTERRPMNFDWILLL